MRETTKDYLLRIIYLDKKKIMYKRFKISDKRNQTKSLIRYNKELDELMEIKREVENA